MDPRALAASSGLVPWNQPQMGISGITKFRMGVRGACTFGLPPPLGERGVILTNSREYYWNCFYKGKISLPKFPLIFSQDVGTEIIFYSKKRQNITDHEDPY